MINCAGNPLKFLVRTGNTLPLDILRRKNLRKNQDNQDRRPGSVEIIEKSELHFETENSRERYTFLYSLLPEDGNDTILVFQVVISLFVMH